MSKLMKIIGRDYYKHPSCPRRARGSVFVKLECGCEKHYKASKEPKTHARCEGRHEER
jgi:hypothetical protein